MQKTFRYVIILLLFSSCAKKFNPIIPDIYNYENRKVLTDSINISYLYDVQKIAQNKPYARKEYKKNLKLVLIKIENNSNSSITITKENFMIKTNTGREIKTIDNNFYTKSIRQYVEHFIIFYGLAGFGYVETNTSTSNTTEITYNPLPLLIGVGNAIHAYIANNTQKQNLKRLQIYDKPIPPKGTLSALIAINEVSYPELNFIYLK